MRSTSPDKERSARHGYREGAKEKRQRRASGWSYSLITCLPCKCSSKELHRQLQETATPFQIIKYWPIKVRTWEWASSSRLSPHLLLLVLSLSSLHRLHLFFNHPLSVPILTLFSNTRTDVVIVCLEQRTWIEGTRVKIPHRRGSKVIKLAIRYSHGCVLPRGKGGGGGSGSSLRHRTWLLLSVIGLYRPSL